jgi:hypothetical protein
MDEELSDKVVPDIANKIYDRLKKLREPPLSSYSAPQLEESRPAKRHKTKRVDTQPAV